MWPRMKRRLAFSARCVAVLALVVIGLSAVVVGPADRADAAVVRPFTTVFSQQTNGSIQITGNTVMTCGTSTACVQAQTGAAAASNNSFTMTYLDVDSDATTTRSSSANLTIPTGGRVIYAGLFWGGARTAGNGGTAATGTAENIKFRAPGQAGYTTLAADRIDNQSGGNSDYSAYRNVTSIVQGAGAGTYWGADIAAATGADRYGAWSLVVAIEDPNAPLRDLTVFSGYATVTNNDIIDTTISGFLAPPSGAVGAKFGGVTYEGDNGLTGDYFQVNNTRLADSLSPSANFFTSRVSAGGANLTNRNPASVNNLGIDAKVVDAPGVVPNGATSANLRFATSGDYYYPAALTTQIDLYAPTIQGSKSVTNLSGNSPAKVGDVLEYSMTFSNIGDDAANNSVISDPIPANTTFVPGSIRFTAGANQGTKTDASGDDQGEYDAANRTVRVRAGTGANATAGGTLAPAATTTVAFQVRVTSAAAGTTLTNAASLAYRAATIGRDYTYNTADVNTPVADEADVSITKTASPQPVTAGNQITYTLTARNNGPNPAAGVQVVDTLPAGVTYVSSNPSAGSCAAAGQTVTCDLGTIANNGTVTIPVVVTVPGGSTATSLTNVARITTTTSDPVPGNNNASATSTVVRQADMALTKSASPTSPVPGTNVTYTLTATNNGASRATGVTITDTLPASLIVRSATSGGATCTITGSEVSCDAGGLDPGQSVTVTVVAGVPPDAGAVPLTNSARVTSSTPDPTPGNNSATAAITPAPRQADLAVTKQAVTSPIVAGRPVQYRVTITNNGPSDAQTVTLTDALPAGLSAASASSTAGSCTVTGGTNVSCALGGLLSGQSAQVTIDAQLAATATGNLVNSATASSPTADPTPGNNTGTATSPITASADLAITKSAAPVVDGAQAVYTIVVTNNGPSVARSVSVSDPVPAPLTYASSSSTQGTCNAAGTPTTVTCAVGDLAPGESATVTVRAGTPGDGSGRGASNTATVSSPTPDPINGNNSATYVLPTTAQADVSLAKTVSPNPVVAGQTVTYTLTATNNGPSVATGVTITDAVPARVTGVSATTSTGGATCAATSGNNVSCSAATMASGATFVVTVTGTVAAGSATGALTNTANVASTTPTDPTPSNNSATATTDVIARADVAVTKTGPATANAGTEAAWVLRVTNNGPSAATGVVLTDALPNGVTFVSSSSTPAGVSCTASDGLVSCPVGDLANGASVEVTVRGNLASGLTAGTALTDIGGVSSTTTDPTPGNNSASHTTTVAEVSDVRISKTSDPATLVPGAQSTYLLAITNAGPSDARNVVVTDTLTTDLTVLESTFDGGACSVSGSTVTCNRALLPVGAEATVRIRVQVASTRTAPVVNTASVSSSTDPGTAGNNSTSLTSDVSPSSDVAVVKTASAGQVTAGEGVTYTLTVVNNGPSAATGVTVADTLPADVVPSTATSTAGTCAVTGQQVDCTLGGVPTGTPVVVTIVARTAAGAALGVRTNTARVASTSADATPGNNTSSVDVRIVAEADVQLTKTANTDTFVPGGAPERRIGWSIVVNNAGPSTARGIVVTDTVPEGVSNVQAFHGINTPCTVVGRQVTCDLGDRVPGQRVITITGELASAYAADTITNSASATTTSPDPTPGNNDASVTTPIVRQADLEITKTVSDANPVAGQRITYTFSAYNRGPSDAVNPQFIDQLPAGLTNVVVNRPTLLGQPATAECEIRQPISPGTADNPNAPTVFCNGQTFRAGLPARVIGSIEATIAPGFTGTLTNTARISSDTIDLTAADNEATATSTVTAGADLSITKTVSPENPVPGQQVTWTVTARNDGPSTARNVVVTDNVVDQIVGLTAGTGATPNPCTITPTGNDVTCAVGDLVPGSTSTVTLTGTLPADWTGPLSNTARVSSPTTDSDPTDNEATVTAPTVGRADVSIQKTVTPTRPVPGQPVTYSVVVANAGPSVARNVVVRDPVPGVLTNVTATSGGTPELCGTAGNQVTCNLGDLAPSDGAVTITIRGDLPPGFEGDLVNTATVESPTDVTPGNNSATASGSTDAQADVSVRKTLSPAAPVPGRDVTYSIVVSNNGPSVARGTTLRDDLNDALTGLTVTTSQGTSCTIAAGNDVTCNLGLLPASGAGSSVVVTITGRLPAGFTGDLTNRAVVDSVTDSTPDNNVAIANGTAVPQADMAITKVLTPSSPVPGRGVQWTVSVTNNGPSVARNVVVSDDVVDDITGLTATTGASPNPCTVGANNQVSCALGAVDPGTTTTITLAGDLPADFTGTLTNTATVASPTADPTTSNNSATVSGTAAANANVGITKTVSPSNPVPGNDVTWTIVVGNTGPSMARDVVVRDNVNDAITGLTATSPCTIATGNDVTCDLGDLDPGDQVVLTLSGGVPPDFTGQLSNTATVASPTDNTPANNTSTANPTTAPGADLSIIKTASPTVPVPGQDITWTVTITNAGPSVARNVVITDPVNPALTDVTTTGPCTVGGNNQVTCSLGDVGVGGVDAVRTITITARVPSDYSGDLSNTATVSSPTDNNTSNNTSTTNANADPQADLSITKTATPANPVPGRDTTWTLTVTNDGPSVASNVVIRDDVDDRITGLSATTGGQPNPCAIAPTNDVTCTIGTMAVGETVTVTIRGGVPAGLTGQLTNLARVTSPDDDATGNNQASTTGTAQAQADVSVTKTAEPTVPVPGQPITWTVTVANAGPSVARSVTMTDDVLDDLTGVTASAAGFPPSVCTTVAGNQVTCNLGDMNPLAVVVITVTGTVPATYVGAVDNTAVVSSPTDNTPDNNQASTQGQTEVQADVSVTKTLSPARPVPGERVTWTVQVTNTGPSTARGVELSDDVDDAISGLTATSDRPSDTCAIAAGNVVTCDLDDVDANTTRVVTLTGILSGGFTGTLANTARVTSPTDASPANNVATVTGETAPRADLSITKSMAPTTPVAGEDVTFTMVVRNAGPSTARQVVVSDSLIDPLSGATASITGGGTCGVAGQQVTCDVASLASGDQVTVTVEARVDAGYTGEVSNVGTVTAVTPDPDTSNNTARVTESGTGSCAPGTRRGKVVACPDLGIDKVAKPKVASPGDRVTYTVTVTNDGPSAATDVEVVDELDEDLTLVSVKVVTGKAEVTTTARKITVVFATLRPRADGVVRIVARLADDASGTVPNVAVASTESPDVGDVEVQDEAPVDVLADDDGDDPGNTDNDNDDDGVLPDTGLPSGVVPLAALSLLLLALGMWLVRRSRVSGR